MKVNLMNYTRDADKLCGAIARTCYSTYDAEEILDMDEDFTDTLDRVVKSGHYSVVEHATFTFSVSGVSRVLSHQLVRHRIASYTQKSQRYVKHSPMETIIPPSMHDEEIRNMIYTLEDIIYDIAEELRGIGIPEEDIRYIYPSSMSTNITITMNARSLLNFFSLRCCNRAQWEIRELANLMLAECRTVAPFIFRYAGAPCVRGSCPEGDLSCNCTAENDLDRIQ